MCPSADNFLKKSLCRTVHRYTDKLNGKWFCDIVSCCPHMCRTHTLPGLGSQSKGSSCQSLCRYLLISSSSQIPSFDLSPPQGTPALWVPSSSPSGPLPSTHRGTETWPTASFFLSAFEQVLIRHLLSSGVSLSYCSPFSSSSTVSIFHPGGLLGGPSLVGGG